MQESRRQMSVYFCSDLHFGHKGIDKFRPFVVSCADNEQQIETRRITIVVGEIEYHIKVNQFNEIELNKTDFSKESEHRLTIHPYQSNDIRLK